MKYKIYFEFFGKRFKMEMQSDNKEAILKYLSTRINIEKIEPLNDTEVFDRLMDIFGFKD